MTDQTTPGWADGQFKLREAMYWWIQRSTERWEHTPWGGGHDEAIFTRTWMTYYMLTGDKTAYEFIDKMANDFIDSPVVEACTCFLTEEDAAQYPKGKRRPPYHGYCEDQACFVHAPENYAWFLTHMVHIDPSPKILKALEDCAEHIGNWSPDSPPWYNWEEHRFRSSLFGTGKVRNYPPYDFETLALSRVMVLASNMYYVSGEQKYLDLCVNWLDKWADIVLSSDPEKGFCPMRFPCPEDEIKTKYGPYAEWAGSGAKLDYELANLLLDVYYHTRKESYAQAVHKMLNTGVQWQHHFSGLLVAKYRAMTLDKSFDGRVVEAADAMLLDESDNRPALLLMCKGSEQFLPMAGLQYLRVFKNERIELDPRRTSVLAAAYMATGDASYLEYAMELGLNRFYDSHYLWDGRELGCRGSWQGRNGIAMLNVIPPLMLSSMGGFGMLEGERPWYEVRYSKADGTPGLPEHVAALFVPGGPKERTVRFYNRGDEAETVRVTADNLLVGSANGPLSVISATLDGTPVVSPENGVSVPPRQVVELLMKLG